MVFLRVGICGVTATSADRERTLQKFRQFMVEGQPRMAYQLYQRVWDKQGDGELPREDLTAYIEGLLRGQYWPESVEAMKQFIMRYPAQATDMRIRLAYTLLTKTNQPNEAQSVMASLHTILLPPSQREKVLKLKAAIAARVS